MEFGSLESLPQHVVLGPKRVDTVSDLDLDPNQAVGDFLSVASCGVALGGEACDRRRGIVVDRRDQGIEHGVEAGVVDIVGCETVGGTGADRRRSTGDQPQIQRTWRSSRQAGEEFVIERELTTRNHTEMSQHAPPHIGGVGVDGAGEQRRQRRLTVGPEVRHVELVVDIGRPSRVFQRQPWPESRAGNA